MHYPTDRAGSGEECGKQNDLSKCILVRYKDHNHHGYGVEKIPLMTTPSVGDEELVKQNYPWKSVGDPVEEPNMKMDGGEAAVQYEFVGEGSRVVGRK